MFQSIDIKFFRGIKSAEINGFKQINLFFGKNNCGKSSILEAIFLITGISNPILPLSINSMRNYKKYSEDDLNIEFFNLDPGQNILISATATENRRLEISRVDSSTDKVNLESISGNSSENTSKSYGLKLSFSIENNENTFTSTFIIQDNETDNGKVSIDPNYKEQIFSQYITSYQQDTVGEDFTKIVANKQENYIADALREIDPSIKDLHFVGKEILVDIGAKQRLPINMMGDGLRKLLMIVLALYRCKDGVLLIDEIDNGFHFSSMKVLWKLILTVAKRNNVQLFASTHNLDSLKGLNSILSDEKFSSYREDVAAFKIIRGKDGDVTALKYDYPSFKYSITQELEIR